MRINNLMLSRIHRSKWSTTRRAEGGAALRTNATRLQLANDTLLDWDKILRKADGASPLRTLTDPMHKFVDPKFPKRDNDVLLFRWRNAAYATVISTSANGPLFNGAVANARISDTPKGIAIKLRAAITVQGASSVQLLLEECRRFKTEAIIITALLRSPHFMSSSATTIRRFGHLP